MRNLLGSAARPRAHWRKDWRAADSGRAACKLIIEYLLHPRPRNPIEFKMEDRNPHPVVSTVELLKEAGAEARALLKAELALARDEAQRQLTAVKRIGIAGGASLLLCIFGLAMLLLALVLGVEPRWLTALLAGCVLL